MSKDQDSPSRSTIAWEIVVYAILFLLVGAAFVVMRVNREGTRVLEVNPRRAR